MSLKQTINDDIKTAMKAREMDKLTVLRSLSSEIKNYEIDNGLRESGASDVDVLKVVAKMAKQINESIAEYKKADRTDLIDEEQVKMKAIECYLPKQMSDEDLKAIVVKVLASADEKSMGPIIGMVMKEVSGQADGNRVSKMVREELN